MRNNSNEDIRREWISQQLRDLPEGARLLDAGAGEQQYRKYCSHVEYVSQDFSQYKPEEVKSGLQMEKWDYGTIDIVSDITCIPDPDSSFDAVLCSEVLEHVPNPVLALQELSRLLKSGGKLIVTAPFCSMTHFAPYHFSSGFNSFFYEYHLPKMGFRILKLEPNGNYFDYLVQELRRADQVAIDYTGQKPSWFEYQALKVVRKMFGRFNLKGDTSEILNFGFHVLAEKL